MKRSLRRRLLVLLVAGALVPAVLAAGLGLAAVWGLGRLAREHASAAMSDEVGASIVTRVEGQSRTHDAVLERVRGSAEALASYVGWLYAHPDYFPAFLKGGTPLLPTPEGHLVNDPTTPVGVFVARTAKPGQSTWAEVGLLSFVDPLLAAGPDGAPPAARSWIISVTGIVRMYPNQRLGHPASPVGPDYDFTETEAFLAASPGRNPGGGPVWTAPYIDPAGGGWMVTAAVPISDASGRFVAVAGVDMLLDRVEHEILTVKAGPDGYAMLVDMQGALICAPAVAYADLGLGPAPVAPERSAPRNLVDSDNQGVRDLMHDLLLSPGPGMTAYYGLTSRRLMVFAQMPSTGWVLAWSMPAGELLAAVSGVDAHIATLQRRFAGGLIAAVALGFALLAVAVARAANAVTRPVARLVEGTRRIGADLSYRLADLGQDELGMLARELNSMADRLERSQAEAVQSARRAAAERQERRLAVLGERNRLAREIHDTIAQTLAGLVLHLDNARELTAAGEAGAAAGHIETAAGLAREGLAEARRSVLKLRPLPELEAGLTAGLLQLAAQFSGRGFAVLTDLADPGPLAPQVEEALYRVAQEALANAARHSGAGAATLRLSVAAPVGDAAEESLLEMVISDQGRGFNASEPRLPGPDGGFGLWVMGDRVVGAGGTFEIRSSPGEGTAITARVRISSPPADIGIAQSVPTRMPGEGRHEREEEEEI